MTSHKNPSSQTLSDANLALILDALHRLTLNPAAAAAAAAGDQQTQEDVSPLSTTRSSQAPAEGTITMTLSNLITLLHGSGVNVISPMEEIKNAEQAQVPEDAQDAEGESSSLKLLPAQRAFIFGTEQKKPSPWTAVPGGGIAVVAPTAQPVPVTQLAPPAAQLAPPAAQLAPPVAQLAPPAAQLAPPAAQLAPIEAAPAVQLEPLSETATAAQPGRPIAQPAPVAQDALVADLAPVAPPTSPTTGPSNNEAGAGVDPSITGFVCTSCHTYNTIRSARETFYCVIAGRAVGVYQGWHNVQPLVSGVGHACYKKYPSEAEALAAFEEARNAGYVVILA